MKKKKKQKLDENYHNNISETISGRWLWKRVKKGRDSYQKAYSHNFFFYFNLSCLMKEY